VKDTGAGIPKNALEKIFQAFTQADGSSTRKHGGTGLGLTISNSMVEKLGSKLKVISEEGDGANFFFTLPFDIENAAAQEVIEEPKMVESILNHRFNAKILVVEDNKVNRLLVRSILQKAGCEVIEAENGMEAINELGLNENDEPVNFDLVLMDIQMPVLDGIQATKKIREKEEGQRVPIVAFTAHAMQGDKEEFIMAGMDDYISKPIRKRELLDLVTRYVPQSKNEPAEAVAT